MSITIPEQTLHQWALDHGYVPLSDITKFVEQKEAAARSLEAAARSLYPSDFAADFTALENPDDLKPSKPELTITDATVALRAVLAAKGTDAARALLNKFGAKGIGEVSPERFQEFMASAAAELK